MSNLTSEYTIDLQIKDDKSKDAIRALEKSLKDLSKTFKNNAIGDDLTQSLEDSKNAAQAMIDKFHEMARDQELDFAAVSKAYSRNAQKAISELEKQYAVLKQQQDDAQKEHAQNAHFIEVYNKALQKSSLSIESQRILKEKIAELDGKNKDLHLEQLEVQIQQNRQIRVNLKSAEQSARMERANAKYEKLKELQAKRKATTDKAERKELTEKIKQQKAYTKAIEQAEKATKKVTEGTGRLKKVWEAVGKHASNFSKATQFAYNATGMLGGVGRTAMGAARAGKAAIGMVSGAISSVASVADQEVEKEKQANRVKGMSNADAMELMQDVYVRTGADYSTIVDAINRVQGLLGKGLAKGDIAQAAEVEIRYPGMSTALASSSNKGMRGLERFKYGASRLEAIQKVTGASVEQLQASSQKMANYRASRFGNATMTDMQAVYLELQNSGAFETEEELDQAFDRFVKSRAGSKNSIFEDAQNYKWVEHVHDQRNRDQAANTLKNIDWGSIGVNLAESGGNEHNRSESENMAMQMRQVEIQKNQMLMKLIPAVVPIVTRIADLMRSDKAGKIIDGFVSIFETVLPMLGPIFDLLEVVLDFLNKYILRPLKDLIDLIASKFSSNKSEVVDEEIGLATPQNANGGIVWGKSIVGERGPEAIIPLDYSRAQRAENISYAIQNSFNMSGNQTTALSLAQAVSSRDFSRAMGMAAFKASRTGAF